MSAFVVSARKYRPTTFDEMVGQDHVAKTLKNALLSGQLAQAFLFTGPRGVGKTTSARILAKIINCENPIDKVAACNQCSSCKAFNDNASFNIFEMDAASNNSVDNIRSLVEQVRFQPQNGRYKVIILDEVHMLSSAAFNAFLKTLEEPPAHAIFILATTEKHKVIPTILSRCQIFDFKRITISGAVGQLKKICEKEGIQADDEALHVIANKADGAMRDALSIFDKIASATNKVITYKDVVANLNLLDYENYFNVIDSIMAQDLSRTFIILDDIINSGFDPEHFLHGLADHCRDLLIAKNPQTIDILDISEDLKRKYLQQATLASQALLLSGISILAQCEIDMPVARNKRLHVELSLSKLVYLPHVMSGNNVHLNAQEKKTELENDTVNKTDTQVVEKQVVTPISTISNVTEEATIANVNNTSNIELEEVNIPSQNFVAKIETIDASSIEQKADLDAKPAPELKPTPKIGVSKLGNIDDIRQSIVASEVTKAEARRNLSIDLIKNIWEDYKENNSSKSVQTALGFALMELSDDATLHIKVPNIVTKDMIAQESNLIERLRHESGEENLKYNIQIDIEKFPEFEELRPNQTVSPREKYAQMLVHNPLLGKIAQELNLKLDNEFG
jgi:DNA polymerase-3 subunit gamma/tau